MKRLWIGILILSVLLASGGLSSWAIAGIHAPIALSLHQAEAAALSQDWPQAEQYSRAAYARWQQHWRFTAAFADHTPMDEVDGLFAELQVYCQCREAQHFAATCAHLAQLTEAMAESHSPSWWNLL